MQKQKVFLNLSNHPSSGWSDSQHEAVQALCKGAQVIDVPFPHVEPTWSSVEVDEEAQRFASSLREDLVQAGQRPLGAMVSGEPILSVSLVLLQTADVDCYCATTKRVSETDAQGVKRSIFTFVRFRQWPNHLS